MLSCDTCDGISRRGLMTLALLELASGKQCHLIRGAYDGATNRAVAQKRLDRLKHVMAKT